MSLKLLCVAAGSALALAVAAAPAVATSPWLVTIHGNWNTNAPNTPYSQYPEAYSVSFNLPQTFTWIYQDPNVTVTTEMTNVHYSLGGVAIPVTLWTGPQTGCFNQAVGTLCNIAFFDTNLMGGLALAFSDHVVEFYGADIGSNGTLVKGQYIMIPNIDDTLVNEGTAFVSVTPEPAAWVMMLMGVFGVGAAARAGRREPVPA